jgi:SCP-2 sterol transfer family
MPPNMRRVATRLLALFVRRASDARIERWFGSRAAQGVLFKAMAAGFDRDAAEGFSGRIVYELSRPATGRPATRWTIDVAGGRAAAHAGGGAGEGPALTVRFALADFVRIAAGLLDPATPLLQDRASIDGDLGLAARLPEMFSAPRPAPGLPARRRRR